MRTLPPLIAVALLAAFSAARAEDNPCPAPAVAESPRPTVQIVADAAPPSLPEYAQPALPASGYVWTPGYWAWNNQDYYWTPGAWVAPPKASLLWTPPYWTWEDGVYLFHPGFWAPHVGYYGGVAYGYGYYGSGFTGARWNDGQLQYNRSVNNLGPTGAPNVYEQPAPPTPDRSSFNGGPQGVQGKPTAEDAAAAKDTHMAATPEQRRVARDASLSEPAFASVNSGKPAVAAVPAEPPLASVAPAPLKPTAEPEHMRPGEPAAKPEAASAEAPKPAPKAEAAAEPKPQPAAPRAWRPGPRHRLHPCAHSGANGCVR